MTEIKVLDHGYVKLIDYMGSDLSITKAARASFAKDSHEWNDKEEKLLKFLIREGHWSCFRHATITYQIKAPLFVARQHFKYQVASAHIDDQNGWNESSRRYVTQEPEFYIPSADQWRSMPENKKQGSAEPIDPRIGQIVTKELIEYIDKGINLYNKAETYGIATEISRLFLPAYGMYVNYQWTTSLAAVLHFLKERLEHDAQFEMQLYAQAVKDLTKDLFPATFGAVFGG